MQILYKILQFFQLNTLAKQKNICGPDLVQRSHVRNLYVKEKKWIYTVFGEYKNLKIYGQKMKLDPIQT